MSSSEQNMVQQGIDISDNQNIVEAISENNLGIDNSKQKAREQLRAPAASLRRALPDK